VLWQRRRFLTMATGVGILLAIGYSLRIPNEYESTAQLMPPDQQSLSSESLLSTLTGSGSVASVGGLISTKTPGAVFIGILNSHTVQDDLINRFDLRRIYHCQFYIDCREKLTALTTIKEIPSSGIIDITVIDRDRYRARDLTEAYVEELDKLVNSLSTSSARREREFLEQRLTSIKADLDASSRALSQFSSRNATINPQNQGQSLLESAARLENDLVTARSELSGLKAQYTDDNVRVREARARIDELQSQLRMMGSSSNEKDSVTLDPGQIYPSIRQLPILGVTYSDLSRQLTMQEGIYEVLTRQYELAKVEEAKEIPPVKVLDEPEVAERKSRPHRLIIVILATLVSGFAGMIWIIAGKFWKITDDSHPTKSFVLELLRSIKSHDAIPPN
jgi:uncharacterized protein involved in exopolysaccharide biosynthesis